MRITVCETPHGPGLVEKAWSDICSHVRAQRSELLLLPEFSFLDPVWVHPDFDPSLWARVEREAHAWLNRLPQLGSAYVVGAFPKTANGKPVNQGFCWSCKDGFTPLRSKCYFPNEALSWEARWFAKGAEDFPVFSAGELRFGLNICTELWALETLGPYARAGANAIVCPRATAAATTERWISLAKTAAIRAGAFSLSSNRRHEDGTCGGVGWVIDPDGHELARTSPSCPAVTVDIDLASAGAAKLSYPRYAFATP